jgi:stress response protein YsnF
LVFYFPHDHFNLELRKIMAQTVIGMFDDAFQAKQAVQQLTSKGFSSDSIDITKSAVNNATQHESDSEESGITQFFKSLFTNKEETDKYVRIAKMSQSLVTVHAKTVDEAKEAAFILDNCGAVNVDERATASAYLESEHIKTTVDEDTNTRDDAQTNSATAFRNTSTERTARTTSISIMEGDPEIGKSEILTDRTHMRSRIFDGAVEESSRLKEETVRVNKNLPEKPKTNAGEPGFSAGEFEMTETSEVPVVTKEARVVEEVTIGKQVNERTTTVSDTVRRTEIDIDDLGKAKQDSTTNSTNRK